MTNLLFVYGTLLLPGNPFANYLHQNCTYVSVATIKGLLYDIGEYPGMILSSTNNYDIHGSIFKLHHPEENLKVFDDYEGFGTEQNQPNLYLRTTISVQTHNGFMDAWIYLYNLPVEGLTQIRSGNYAEYMKQKKSPGY